MARPCPCISGPELLARLQKRWPGLAPLPAQESAALGDGPAVYYTAPGWQGERGLYRSGARQVLRLLQPASG